MQSTRLCFFATGTTLYETHALARARPVRRRGVGASIVVALTMAASLSVLAQTRTLRIATGE